MKEFYKEHIISLFHKCIKLEDFISQIPDNAKPAAILSMEKFDGYFAQPLFKGPRHLYWIFYTGEQLFCMLFNDTENAYFKK